MRNKTREENNLMPGIVALTDFSVPEAQEKICEGEQKVKNAESASVAYYAGDFASNNEAKKHNEAKKLRSKQRKTNVRKDRQNRIDGPKNRDKHMYRVTDSNCQSIYGYVTNGNVMHSDRRRMSAAEYKLKEYCYESEAGTDVDRADTTTEKETIVHTENMTDHITQVFVDALIKDGVSPDVAHDLAMNIWLACDDYNLAEVAYGNVK